MIEEISKSELEKAAFSPVRIIASNEGEVNNAEGRWQDYIEITVPCLLTVNASAMANYSGSRANAGIRLYIKIEGKVVASDMCFEGESSNITFFSSASTTVFLKPGRYNIEVDRVDQRTNSGFGLKASYFAVYAKQNRIID